MEGLPIFELLIFSFYGVRFSDMDIIVSKYKEVPLFSKAYGHYRAHKVYVNIPIRLCCPLLRCFIVSFCGFCLVAAIAYITFNIINRGNVVMGKITS